MNNLHYYSKDLGDLESKPAEFIFNFLDHQFKFHTDSGVFSKNYIDFGSFTLLKAFKPNTIDLPVLDMGAGYGPIGIVISKIYKKKVYMAEINPRAFDLLNKNIKENNVDCISLHSDLFEKIDDNQLFSSILTNPPIRAGKKVIYAIYDNSYNHLAKDGELWVVIKKEHGAPSTKAHLEELFGNCEVVMKNKGYYILKSKKC